MSPLAAHDGGVRLTVRAQPRASRNAIVMEADGRIRVAITQSPVDDAANRAVCRFLAKELGLPARSVALVQGARARDKVVHIAGLTPEQVHERLANGQASG
jgi:uncharacterized protein (TIGR00251 family)